MINDALRASVLSVKLIPNVDAKMAEELNLPNGYRSIGIITADSDDVTYTALDEATKMAEVVIVYAKSFYGGAANANTKLAGEVIGIMAGPNPAEVKSGLNAAVDFIENGACFYSANEDDTVPYYAHCVSRTVCTRCSIKSSRCKISSFLWTTFRNKLWWRIINRKSISL